MSRDTERTGDIHVDLDHRLAEFDLGMTRRVMQRNEGLALGHVVTRSSRTAGRIPNARAISTKRPSAR